MILPYGCQLFEFRGYDVESHLATGVEIEFLLDDDLANLVVDCVAFVIR